MGLQFQLSSLPNDAALTSTLRISNVRTFDAAAAAVPLPNAAAAGFAGLVCVALIGAVRRRRAQRLG